MKPERIQIFQNLAAEAKTILANLTAVLQWVEVAARELGSLLGPGNAVRKS